MSRLQRKIQLFASFFFLGPSESAFICSLWNLTPLLSLKLSWSWSTLSSMTNPKELGEFEPVTCEVSHSETGPVSLNLCLCLSAVEHFAFLVWLSCSPEDILALQFLSSLPSSLCSITCYKVPDTSHTIICTALSCSGENTSGMYKDVNPCWKQNTIYFVEEIKLLEIYIF